MSSIIISLDGNIGAGKSTLLNELRTRIPELHFVDEPVGQWVSLKNREGKNLLELFYEDRKRWAYTFQNCAILTRLKTIQKTLDSLAHIKHPPQVIITERSVLTDRYVFAEMLKESGDIDLLEWDLYMTWFDTFARRQPVKAIIYISTSAVTSKHRIEVRNRQGEDKIDMKYLKALDDQHKKWVENTDLPVLTISTEEEVPVEENVEKIREFIERLKSI